jgi:hypothetical protein
VKFIGKDNTWSAAYANAGIVTSVAGNVAAALVANQVLNIDVSQAGNAVKGTVAGIFRTSAGGATHARVFINGLISDAATPGTQAGFAATAGWTAASAAALYAQLTSAGNQVV